MHVVFSAFFENNNTSYEVTITGNAAHADVETVIKNAFIKVNGVKCRYKNGVIEPANFFQRRGLFLPKIEYIEPISTSRVKLFNTLAH